MKPDPTLRQTVLLFHSACGGIERDGFAPYQLPDGENIEWRIRPLSATRIGRIDLDMRGGRRTLELRPDRPLAILPLLRCFGPRIPDTDALRAALHVLRDPRIQRQAIKHYSPPFARSMEEVASAIAQRLQARRRAAPQPVNRAATPQTRAPNRAASPPRTRNS